MTVIFCITQFLFLQSHSYMCSHRLKMNLEMLKGRMELAENYMSNGLHKLLLVSIHLYLG